MRFMHLNHRYWPFPGGSERWVQEVSEHFVRLGHNVRVITSDAHDLEHFWRSDRASIDAPSHESSSGVSIERLPVSHGTLSGDLRFGVARRLQGEVSRVDGVAAMHSLLARNLVRLRDLDSVIVSSPTPDMVHVTNLGLEGLAVSGARAAIRLGVPYIITPFTHVGRDDDPIARRYVSMPHQRQLLKRAAAVMLMSRREREFVIDQGVTPSKTFVVGAGVWPDEVRGGDGQAFRRRHGLGNEYLVGAIGALAPDKGTPHLVEAITALRRRGKLVQLVLAGPSLSAFDEWLGRRQGDIYGIKHLGVISDQDKRDMLAAIDVLALPSRTESFGIVYLEAWAVEKPVIAAGVGGVLDIVTDGEDGVLVPFGDVSALSAAIQSLMNDAGLAARLGKQGAKQVEIHHRWDKVLRRVERGYDHALAPASVRGVD